MRKSKKEIFIILGFLMIAFFMQFPTSSSDPLVYGIYNITILVVYVCIVSAWRASIQSRVLHRMMKMHADGIVFFMIVWIIARTLRNTVFYSIEPWERWCWYMYYIPMILIPMFCFMSARCMGKPEDWKPEKGYYIMYIPAFLMIIGVMTNDIHQLVFKIRDNADGTKVVYGRGILYYCIICWSIVLAVAMLIILVKKCRVPGTKKILWFPISAILIGGIGSMAYIANQINGFVEFSVVSCGVIITTWESCIWMGLIPSNTYYEEMLYGSTVSAIIVDRNNTIRYKAENALSIPEDTIEAAKSKLIEINQNLRLRCVPISGGHVLWTEDISSVNDILSELEEIRHNLEESNDLLSAEISLKQKKAKIDEKNRLYDAIAENVERELNYLRNMLKGMTEDDELLKVKFAIFGILGAYIKRRTNLSLLKEKADKLPAEELVYCIRESLESMKSINISCSFKNYVTGEINADIIILIYNIFQRTVEKALNNVYSFLVNLEEQNHYIYLKMIVEDYRELLPGDFCRDEIKRAGGVLNVEEIDGAEHVVLKIPKGGVDLC